MGIDEVGRGALAGPVVAYAVVLKQRVKGIADSKTLSQLQRRQIAARIYASGAITGLGVASSGEVDRYNIRQASILAMKRAACAIIRYSHHSRIQLFDQIIVDGRDTFHIAGTKVRAIVKADVSVMNVAAASVLAKVARDRLMRHLAGFYPGYGWESNAGYPTPSHKQALCDLGITSHHRRSFAPVSQAVKH